MDSPFSLIPNLVVLDSKGDGLVILPKPLPSIQVSVTAVSLASNVLGNKFDLENRLAIAPDDSPVAASILLRVFHFLDPAVSADNMTPELLAEIADLCLKWQCVPAVGPYTHFWVVTASEKLCDKLEPWLGWLKIGKAFAREDVAAMVIQEQAYRWWKDLGFANLDDLRRVVQPSLINELNETRMDVIQYIGKAVSEQLIWLSSQEDLCLVTDATKEESEMCSSALCGSFLRILHNNVLMPLQDQPFEALTIQRLIGNDGLLKDVVLGLKEHPVCRAMAAELQMSLVRKIEQYVADSTLKYQVFLSAAASGETNQGTEPANSTALPVLSTREVVKTHVLSDSNAEGEMKLNDNSEPEHTEAEPERPTAESPITMPFETTKRETLEPIVEEPVTEFLEPISVQSVGEPTVLVREDSTKELGESIIEESVEALPTSVAEKSVEDLRNLVADVLTLDPREPIVERSIGEPVGTVAEESTEESKEPVIVEQHAEGLIERAFEALTGVLKRLKVEQSDVQVSRPVVVGHIEGPMELLADFPTGQTVNLTVQEADLIKGYFDSLDAEDYGKQWTAEHAQPVIEEAIGELVHPTAEVYSLTYVQQKPAGKPIPGPIEVPVAEPIEPIAKEPVVEEYTKELVPEPADTPTGGLSLEVASETAGTSVGTLLEKLDYLTSGVLSRTVENPFEEFKIDIEEPVKVETPAKVAQEKSAIGPMDAPLEVSSDFEAENNAVLIKTSSPAAEPDATVSSTFTGDHDKKAEMVHDKSADIERCQPSTLVDVDVSKDDGTPVGVPIIESPPGEMDALKTAFERLDHSPAPKGFILQEETLDDDIVEEEENTDQQEEDTDQQEEDTDQQEEDTDQQEEDTDQQEVHKAEEREPICDKSNEADRSKAPSSDVQETDPDVNAVVPVGHKSTTMRRAALKRTAPDYVSFQGTRPGISHSPPLKRSKLVDPDFEARSRFPDTKKPQTEQPETKKENPQIEKNPSTLGVEAIRHSPLPSATNSTVAVRRLGRPNWTNEERRALAASLVDPARKGVLKYLRAKYKMVSPAHVLDIVNKHNWDLTEAEKAVEDLHNQIYTGQIVL
ncbi:hypothetical protein BZA05DRAFT_440519 [Tricharina praecox]|uniref:uncharacterized protein n=1 Tax=Tricharina praecox TaxID=43433 RepID=UPI00221FE801|nr:uncharacterized protein BZA05DRAFT_440519 [Tricharina praecox]KAI5858905.1 hypothetical protein BZA05DRAFT_440519 [Tricharina praecox]